MDINGHIQQEGRRRKLTDVIKNVGGLIAAVVVAYYLLRLMIWLTSIIYSPFRYPFRSWLGVQTKKRLAMLMVIPCLLAMPIILFTADNQEYSAVVVIVTLLVSIGILPFFAELVYRLHKNEYIKNPFLVADYYEKKRKAKN